jgi:hypothetical protein
MEKTKSVLESPMVAGALVNPSSGEEVRPFNQVHVPEEKLADLKRRISTMQ